MPEHLNQSPKRVLITGGAGFIGGTLVRKLLLNTSFEIFNLDKLSYASNLKSIEKVLKNLNSTNQKRYKHLKVDLVNKEETDEVIKYVKPDIIFHFAAESHVDRSINGPEVFLQSNVIGTFNILQSSLQYWEKKQKDFREKFRFHHISTDEVYGSLNETGIFSEKTNYSPKSPYSATKAASDHLVNAWHHTYGLPTLITNCSNNYGPWQYPEKLIPVVILKALQGENIPIYGNGLNIRDWLFVDDHIDAINLVSSKSKPGKNYCIGGGSEKTNIQLVNKICDLLDAYKPKSSSYKEQISFVEDRPGHDFRYGIDFSLIKEELGWEPKTNFDRGIDLTVKWYLENLNWCRGLKA